MAISQILNYFTRVIKIMWILVCMVGLQQYCLVQIFWRVFIFKCVWGAHEFRGLWRPEDAIWWPDPLELELWAVLCPWHQCWESKLRCLKSTNALNHWAIFHPCCKLLKVCSKSLNWTNLFFQIFFFVPL